MAAEAGGGILGALDELNVHTFIKIPHVWKFDFSITNAVVYVWFSALVVFVLFYVAARIARKKPGKLQTLAEVVLNFGLNLTGIYTSKGKKYYYIYATIFSFIFITNLIGLIPKPAGIWPYTPTANISVTFSMAIVIFALTQYFGIKNHGVRGYTSTFLMPKDVPTGIRRAMNVIFFPVEILGQLFRPLSLSVRLFANTIAGHIIILVMLGMLLQYRFPVGGVTGLFVIAMTAFEIFVAFIQAYIFSLLSVVYLEGAMADSH
jgi:F-type H+-transporting ATPase subunit a